MKESFRPKAYIVRGIENPANICFYAPNARSASDILSGAMQRCVRSSTGQSASKAVCRPAASGSAMTGWESWERCPACGLYSAVHGSHIPYRSVKPRVVFSASRLDRFEYQRHPVVPRPALFHFRKLRSRLRRAAYRYRRQGHELSVLFLYIRSRRPLRRLFRERTNRLRIPVSNRSALYFRLSRADRIIFLPMSRLPAICRGGRERWISDSTVLPPGPNTTSPRLSEPIKWCSGLCATRLRVCPDLCGAGEQRLYQTDSGLCQSFESSLHKHLHAGKIIILTLQNKVFLLIFG